MEPAFEIIEHPADVGIEARGANLEDIFRQAASGLVALITERAPRRSAVRKTVSLTGTDAENLLVRWLSELLYLFDAEHFLLATIRFDKLTERQLEAVVEGEQLDPSTHPVRLDVKAVTYHQLSIRKTPDGMVARVIFDI